ncbi:hypothetical protein MAM1_1054d11436, partial [Mucor ambiguus]
MVIYINSKVTQQAVPMDIDSNESSKLSLSDQILTSSDRRRYLSGKIAQLKQKLFKCVMQGITHDDTTEEAKRLTAVALKFEKAEKAFKLLVGQKATLVPNETPLFQWR